MRKTCPGGPNAGTCTRGEAHIKEAPFGRLHKGGREAFGRPPPFVDSFIWDSPWVRVCAFGPPGQVFLISITLMCHFAYGFPLGYGRGTIELPLTTIKYPEICQLKQKRSKPKISEYPHRLGEPTPFKNRCKMNTYSVHKEDRISIWENNQNQTVE